MPKSDQGGNQKQLINFVWPYLTCTVMTCTVNAAVAGDSEKKKKKKKMCLPPDFQQKMCMCRFLPDWQKAKV